MSKAFT
jgi:hypothetical protein